MADMENIVTLVKDHLGMISANAQERNWVILSSPLEGRGLFADCDINSGDLIFVDHPLIMGPRMSATVCEGCITCNSVLRPLQTCANGCGLPMCSVDCQDTPKHVKECQLITSWKTSDEIRKMDRREFFRSVVPLRALLLNDSQKEFLRSLAVHESPRHGSEVRFIKKYFDVSPDEERLMFRACCALDANAYEMMVQTADQEQVTLRGLFPVAALMNHSCSPNTRTSFDKEGKMYVRASAFIPAGCEVFTSYTGLLWGTPARRHHLMSTKHFLCECFRCMDKTEFGTNLAALRCIDRSCPGSLLPQEPLELSGCWSCEKCAAEVGPKQIGALQTAIARLVGSVQLDTPDNIYNFMINNILKFLPESNHIVVELKCKIIWSLGEKPGYLWNELPVRWARLGEQLVREVLEVCLPLGLGGAPLAARLRLRLHCLLLRSLTLTAACDPDTQRILKLEKEVVDSINECYEVLKDDITAPKDLEYRRNLANTSLDQLIDYVFQKK